MSTPSETHLGRKIRKYREDSGLSQEQVAKKLAINRVSYTQIEMGKRKVTTDEIVSLARLFNTTPDVLLGIKSEIEVDLEEKKKTKRPTEMRINVPQKRLGKFKEVLLYLLGKVGAKPNVGETVLYKLLYFIDFDYYEKYEEQLIGATYIKNHYGPTPVEFRKIVESMEGKDLQRETVKYFDHPQTRYCTLREPDLSVLTGQEMKHIDGVIERLAYMNAAEISNYSHQDVPWLTTQEGKPIDYEKAFYRTPPYSVRRYD